MIGDAIDTNVSQVDKNIVWIGDSRRNISVTKRSNTEWNYTIIDINGGQETLRGEGTVIIPDVDFSSDDFLSTFTTLTATFDGSLPATKFYETIQKTQKLKADIEVKRTDDGADVNVTHTELATDDGTKLGITGFTTSIGYDYNASNSEDPVTLHYVKVNNITLDGTLTNNYTATGIISLGYTINDSLATNGGFTEVYTSIADGHVGCYSFNDSSYVDYANSSFKITIQGTTYTVTTDNYGYFHTEIEGVQYYYDDYVNANKIFFIIIII